MASPTVPGVSSSAFASATLWSIAIPPNTQVGDLLIAIVRTGTTPTVTGLSGAATWTLLMSDGADATDDNTYVYYGKCTTIAGSIAISLSAACKGAGVVYAVRGAADPAVQAPNVSTRQIFTTAANAGNSPAIALAGVAKDYLFITALGLGGTAGASDIPTGYNGQYFFGTSSTGGSAATNCGVYAVTRAATVGTSEDPSGWTHGAANLGGCAFTIAVHPAGPPPKYGTLSLPITFGKSVAGDVKIGEPIYNALLDDFNRADGTLSDGAGSTIWSGHQVRYNTPSALGVRSNALEMIGDPNDANEVSLLELKSDNDFIFDFVGNAGGSSNVDFFIWVSLKNTGNTQFTGTRIYHVGNPGEWYAEDWHQGSSVSLQPWNTSGVKPVVGDQYWVRTKARKVMLCVKHPGDTLWTKIQTWDQQYAGANPGAAFGFELPTLGLRIDNLRGGPISVTHYGAVSLPVTFNKEVAGKRKAFGSVSLPITFNKKVNADLIYSGIKTQIDSMDDLAGWGVFYRDYYPGLQQSTDRVEGTGSFLFGGGDISDGVGGFQKTLSPQNLTRARWISFYVKSWYDIGYDAPNGRPLYVRLGTSSTVYWQGTLPANSIKDNDTWIHLALELNTFVAVGGITSWDAITYIAFSWATPGGALAYYDDVSFISPRLTFTSKVVMPITFDKQVRGRLGKNYHDEVLADSPLVYWRMDEVGFPQDHSGNGYHVTTDAGSIQVPGLVPFEPNSMAKRVVDAMARNSPFFTHNTMTFEVWLQRGSTTAYEVLIDQYNSGWTIAVNSDGRIGLRRSYGPDIAWSNRIRITDNLPHHLTVSRKFSTGEAIFYLDDQVPESVIGTLYEHGAPANYPCFIGSQWGAYVFTGTLDEMAIYPYVLSPEQIAYHQTTGSRQAPKTLFGVTALNVSFNKEVSGTRKTFSKTNAPLTFGKAVSGARKTFSKVDSPISFGIVTSGIRVGLNYYGQVALPITFSKDVKGQRKSFGRTALPITFAKEVNGVRKTFGKLDLPIVGGQYVRGIIHSYSKSSMQTLFGKETAGQRKTFGQVALPLIFSKDVRGKRKTFGRVALPIVFDANTIAQRQTFGQVTAPFIFDSSVQGTRTAFGKFDLPMNLRLMVGEGHLGVHGKVSLPMVVSFDISGKVLHAGIILNNAEMIYLGDRPVIAVYTNDQQVWPELPWSPRDILGLATWLDASQDSFADGESIINYVEHSSAHRIFTAAHAIPPATPVFHAGAGRPYLKFDTSNGITGGFISDALWNPGPTGLTFVSVIQIEGGSYPMFVVWGPTANGFEMRHDGSSLQTVLMYASYGIYFSNANPTGGGVDHIYQLRVDVPNQRTESVSNGNKTLGPSLPAMPNTAQRLFIGKREDQYPFIGKMYETLIFEGPISDEDQINLDAYLREKWGL